MQCINAIEKTRVCRCSAVSVVTETNNSDTNCEVSLRNGCIVRFTLLDGNILVQRKASKTRLITDVIDRAV